MKVLLEEKDKKYSKAINDALNNGEDIPIPITKKDKKYYLEFICDDIGKANAFAMYFIHNNADIEEISNILGISNVTLKSNINSNADDIKKILSVVYNEIDDVIDML